jgi:G:T-mismatch repair DNA endonuclease (very short patch repair protein)
MQANNIIKQEVTVVWLTPIRRARDERAMRLIRLLSVGLRVLTLTECIVHWEAQTNHGAADSRALPTGL